MFLSLIISYFIATYNIDAVRVGIIYNTSLTLSGFNITVQKSTCKQCLCMMFNITSNSSIQSLNCYANSNNNVTCQMFTADMYISSSFFQLMNSTNSTFYFLQLPSINESTTVATTTLSSKYLLQIPAVYFIDKS